MKGLLKHLSPFSPDISGAVSVLFELGGMLVILDAGGCAGNVCGFDEPRWFSQRSAVFSAGLRDMDAILGRDDKLMEKIGDALESVDADFIGLIGTPVPSVIGTDFQALKRMAEKRFGLPAVTIDANGMETYEKGQEKAYLAVLKLCEEARENPDSPAGKLFVGREEMNFRAGILGATPLDLPAADSAALLSRRLEERGEGKSISLGYGSGLAAFGALPAAEKNIVISPSALAAAEYLQKKYGTPYECGFFPEQKVPETGRTLIIHQQIFADSLRCAMRLSRHGAEADVASFFRMNAPAEEGDVRLKGEEDLLTLVRERDYDTVMGDPLFYRLLKNEKIHYVNLPHFAVSGSLYAAAGEEEYFERAWADFGK